MIFLLILSCTSKVQTERKMKTTDKELTYLALGDSYTIGESVEESERWPVQLSKKLTSGGIAAGSPRIIATTGWTTDELSSAIKDAGIDRTYDLVSLLIGVNNQYRGYPFETYTKEFTQLLNTAISIAGNTPDKVFVVSIPDYGVTPFGKKKDPLKIATELDQYNATAKEICETKNVTFINITDISKMALNDSTLVANDGLHPSGRMYTAWVDRIYPEVKQLLNNN